ncbi:MAG: hypothetical protein IPM48_00680 [Saprospiraceae bacterium]|nr:hypothetical protein [Saprospiraceae bacterium]
MTKQAIGIIVGAILLFLWQFLSWSMLGIHSNEFTYTANQQQILDCLAQNLTEEGTYMLPGVPPGSSMEEEQALMEQNMGKPWASVTYHKVENTNMGMNMFRGFLVDIVALFFLVWILMRLQNNNLMTSVQASVMVGLIAYLTIPYTNSIWFSTQSMGYLIDAVVSWGLVGLWLGWWMNRS